MIFTDYGISPRTYEVVRAKFMVELKTAFPDPQVEMKFAKLEKLPYLTPILKEFSAPRLPSSRMIVMCRC